MNQFSWMKKISTWGFVFPLFIFIGLPLLSAETVKPFDHSAWDNFLKQYVNEEGLVDYQGVVEDPQLLETYLKQLTEISSYDYGAWPREERLSIWLNAYHAGIIDIIRQNYPLKKTIQEIEGVWELKFVQVQNHKYSLNDIRKEQLIKKFRDEKIHLALACGAKSCPKLKPEAFQGSRVEGQLFLATQRFVNDSYYNQIVPGEKKIKISKLFKWYGNDFELDFGIFENERGLKAAEYAVLSFLAHYSQDVDVIEYLEEGAYKIKYLPFDWSLNEWHRSATTTSDA